jgi:hypothetical protein
MYPIDLQELSLETGSLAIAHDHEFSEIRARSGGSHDSSPEMTPSA